MAMRDAVGNSQCHLNTVPVVDVVVVLARCRRSTSAKRRRRRRAVRGPAVQQRQRPSPVKCDL